METDVNEMIEKAARVTHEANRAWCIANGDMSQPRWLVRVRRSPTTRTWTRAAAHGWNCGGAS